MADTLKARDAKDVEDAVVWALSGGKTFEVLGRGTMRALGRPIQSDLTLDVSALSGVLLYEPEELVLSAMSGTPLAEVEALVAAHGQELAFEPMDYAGVLGGPVRNGSLGGALAANLSGPRRIKAGSARDHFLGVTAVSGRGEGFKSGGRVVKNVTGYDLCKLLAGSFGTLAVMTEVTIKTLPRAETEATVALLGLDDQTANRAMTTAMGASCDVSGAAHLPAAATATLAAALLARGQAMTVFRVEGVEPSVRHRQQALAAQLKSFGPIEHLDESHSRTLWRCVRDVEPFVSGVMGERPLWRVSVAPARGHELLPQLPPDAQWFFDWAGGLIWVAMPRTDDAGAGAIRTALSRLGGHGTLVRAPAALRAKVDVFEPQPAALAAVMRRVKEGFDPRGVLNPGRMWAGV